MEHSFGVIPLQVREGKLSVFTIQNYSDAWLLPKGHQEEGETPQEAAQRELFEETGLRVRQWLDFGPFLERYTFTRSNRPIHKQVDYFPALVEGTIFIQKAEIKSGQWVFLDKVEERLTFEELKVIARQVVAHYADSL
jgi:bis(5'-nucleosidyl)-tetraphosphatase